MKSAKINSTDFNKVITCTKQFLAKETKIRPIHSFIRLEFSKENSRVTAVAVDGYRLSVEHSVVTDLDEDFVAYIKPNFSLPKDKETEISVEDGVCYIECNGILIGYDQPENDEGFVKWRKAIPCREPILRIAFNGHYLLQALQAAKASAGGFKEPVVLEFTGPLDPVLLRTGADDVKMVLPVRCRREFQPLPYAEKEEKE